MESLTEASRLRKGCPDGYPSLSIARLLCSIMNAGSGDFRTPVTHDQKGFRLAKALADVASGDFRRAPYQIPRFICVPPSEAQSRTPLAILRGQVSL
jgi:hypothetical protein